MSLQDESYLCGLDSGALSAPLQGRARETLHGPTFRDMFISTNRNLQRLLLNATVGVCPRISDHLWILIAIDWHRSCFRALGPVEGGAWADSREVVGYGFGISPRATMAADRVRIGI